jgi:hypothetical protein
VFDAGDEIGAQALNLAVQANVGQAQQQLFKKHLDFDTGQVLAQALVWASQPKGDLFIGAALDVEAIRLRELSLIVIG